MDAIIAALDQLELGSPITAANLTMYPLLLPEESEPGYLTRTRRLPPVSRPSRRSRSLAACRSSS